MKKLPLSVIDIFLPIIMFILLLIFKLSENTIYLIIMTLFIGWVLPYFVLLLTGFAQVKDILHKPSLIFNIICIPMTILLLYFVITLYDKKMIIFIVEYLIIIIMNILNIIYYIKYIRSNPNEENKRIKEIKKANNGAIV